MLRIGERQAGALETYVFDPAHVGFEEARAAMLLQQETRNGSYYLSFYPEAVNEIYWGLVEAANSADADVERLTARPAPGLARTATRSPPSPIACSGRVPDGDAKDTTKLRGTPQ